jgi:hypothetical protein
LEISHATTCTWPATSQSSSSKSTPSCYCDLYPGVILILPSSQASSSDDT